MKSLYEKLNGSYVEVGDIQIPAIVSVDSKYEIGFWGQRHKEYLKQNRRVIYYNLLTQGKLNSYLHNIDIRAKERYDLLVKQLAKSQVLPNNPYHDMGCEMGCFYIQLYLFFLIPNTHRIIPNIPNGK